jgi:endoplasmic reticulum junction formation protein lunapark
MCVPKKRMHCLILFYAGLARKEDYPDITYYCPRCHALNTSKQSMGQYSGSSSGRSTPVVPADSSSAQESALSNLTTLQELAKEGNVDNQEAEAS